MLVGSIIFIVIDLLHDVDTTFAAIDQVGDTGVNNAFLQHSIHIVLVKPAAGLLGGVQKCPIGKNEVPLVVHNIDTAVHVIEQRLKE
ncbi:hypothetical protein SDC9_123151 [bioreactor metagenome]|uniref:Uncharacterized protein n=1 Tax=bioreactor metagenome TaxID=1076179 RepID=A0A645CGV4_9ZZZZ